MKLARSAKVLILDKNNNVLVLRRSNTHPWSPLQPDLPGGIIENGESPAVGLSREIVEETGLVIPVDGLTVVNEYQQYFEPADTQIERVMFKARVEEIAPMVILSYEHDQYSWRPLDALDLEATMQLQADVSISGDTELSALVAH